MPPNVTTPVQSKVGLCEIGTGNVAGKQVLRVVWFFPCELFFHPYVKVRLIS
jgi:hypothetical protein